MSASEVRRLHHSSNHAPIWIGRPWQKVHFTHWQDAIIPLPNATAPIITEALDSCVFCYFGLPEELHSDRGTQREVDLMTEYCAMWKITKTSTTANHPQSNGVVERRNRTLGDSLRCLLLTQMEAQENWDIMLPQIMRAFRATSHAATEKTANYLMLGRECRLPDQLTGGTHDVDENTRSEYASHMQHQLDTAYRLIRTRQMHPPRLPDQVDAIFKEGDLVLVQTNGDKKGSTQNYYRSLMGSTL